MIFWIDAQLPPDLATWLSRTFHVEAHAIADLGLRDAEDPVIFERAKSPEIVIVSKDSDFVELISHYGPPPRLLWVTCGNVTNVRLREVFEAVFLDACSLLNDKRTIVEIGDKP